MYGDLIEQPHDEFQIGAVEALRMSNDPAQLTVVGEMLLPQLMALDKPVARIQMAVESVLGRSPTSAEVATMADYVAHAPEFHQHPAEADSAGTAEPQSMEEAWRQVIWALTTSAELRFNH